MRPRYKVSQAGIGLIESFEGYRAEAARLADGRWTIGYGHTRSAREGAEISRDDARILLQYVDLPPVEEAIHALVLTPLTQNQYDALVAFVFNVGTDAFAASAVLKRLNEGGLTEAACAMELWRKAEVAGDPVVLDALIRRRAAEKTLFLTPPEGFVATPSPLVRPEFDARAAEGLPKRRPVAHEAPLQGGTAEVKLVGPFEVEPPLETPTAFTPAPAAEPAPDVAEEVPTTWTAEVLAFATPVPTHEEAPTAWTPEPAQAEEPAEEGPTAWTAEPEAEESAEEAPTGWTSEPTAEEPVEEAPTAWTAEPTTDEPVEEAPTAWTAEPEAEQPEPTSPAIEAEAEEPTPTAWTAEPEAEAPAPAAAESAPEGWGVFESPAAADESPKAEPVALPPGFTRIMLEPANNGAASHETPEVQEPEAYEPESVAAEAVAPEPATFAETASPAGPEAASRFKPLSEVTRERPLYSSYGPMAFAVRPMPATPSEPATPPASEGEGDAAEPADSEPHPAPEPGLIIPPTTYGSPVAADARTLAEMAPAPVVTAEAPAPEPLVLTPPPADWEERPNAYPAMTTATLAAEADELETPLFDEGWDATSALGARIVRHEAVAEPEETTRQKGATGPYVLLGLIGFVAFAGALFAFWRRAPGAGVTDPKMLAWALALIGGACVGISVYFLFKRLGGAED